MIDILQDLQERLLLILRELRSQPRVAATYAPDRLPYDNEMAQIAEYIDAGETGIAYETIVAALESHPFSLSSNACIKLLEAALLMRYKTETPEDSKFDFRKS